ncbi:hypothetical protein K2X40_03605 [Candidatus Babeliales bacterium]|nr:hypothetical protein [Candidatus Babeliales bacterium]
MKKTILLACALLLPCAPIYTAAEHISLVNFMKTGGLHTPEKCAHVKRLINSGAMVDQQDAAGNTPLYIASCQACPICVQALLSGGADRNIKNKYKETALELITRRLQESRVRRPVTSEQLEACKILLESLS